MSLSGPWSKRRRTLAKAMAILIVLLVVPHLVASYVAQEKLRRVDERWATKGRSFATTRARHVTRDTNPSARALGILVAELGLPLDPASAEGAEQRPSEELLTDGAAAAVSAGVWLTTQLEDPASSMRAVPEEIRIVLMEHGDSLAAVRQHLVENAIPAWSADLDAVMLSSAPNFKGFSWLNDVLMVEALRLEAAGDAEAAARTFQAGWNLNSGLRDRPSLLAQLYCSAMARRQAGVARRLSGLVAAAWAERFLEFDHHASIGDAMLLEGIRMNGVSLSELAGNGDQGRAWWNTVVNTAAQPYVDMAGADIASVALTLVSAGDGVLPCVPHYAAQADLAQSVQQWNPLSRLSVGTFSPKALVSGAETMLQLELSAVVLNVRRGRGETGSARSDEWSVQARCEHGSWLVKEDEQGGFSVSYVGPDLTYAGADDDFALAMPLRHSESADR